jgi:hypothetical protein
MRLTMTAYARKPLRFASATSWHGRRRVGVARVRAGAVAPVRRSPAWTLSGSPQGYPHRLPASLDHHQHASRLVIRTVCNHVTYCESFIAGIYNDHEQDRTGDADSA